jgi:hypothetical protein
MKKKGRSVLEESSYLIYYLTPQEILSFFVTNVMKNMEKILYTVKLCFVGEKEER